jgi:hypothetical protein
MPNIGSDVGVLLNHAAISAQARTKKSGSVLMHVFGLSPSVIRLSFHPCGVAFASVRLPNLQRRRRFFMICVNAIQK